MGTPAPTGPATLVLDLGRRYTLHVVNVGLACCAVEAMVATLSGASPAGSVPYAVPEAGEERGVDVLLVSGTVTDKLAPLVRQLHDALQAPVVVSFGACANSGGPYWDSYCVTKGVDRVVPVDVWVPGCPPRPEALLDALRSLRRAGEGAEHGTGARSPHGLEAPPLRPVEGPVEPRDLRARPA